MLKLNTFYTLALSTDTAETEDADLLQDGKIKLGNLKAAGCLKHSKIYKIN